jgi:hypothetical protein
VAIINFKNAVSTRTNGNVYFTYAFLSPSTSSPKHTPPQTLITICHQLGVLQAKLHINLDSPLYFHFIPNFPPISKHLCVTMPFVNNMSESLHFLIKGISVNLLLGPSNVENTLTLRHLGYLIFRTVKTLHSTFPPHLPFPPELSKLKTCFDIEGIISVKKVRFNKPLKPTPTSTPNHIRPLLGDHQERLFP